MKITRNVVSDLWPLYVAGEASPDSRAVVDEFLRGDPELARRLEESRDFPVAMVSMPPDEEARALARTRDLILGGKWLRGLRLFAAAITVLGFLHLAKYSEELFRIARDSQRVEFPDRVAFEAAVAVVSWLTYMIMMHRVRERALR
ncbi:MAG TPA: hypothetical protein VH740_03375 [Vicinamibacterales bacterium]|jgi:hypothetical protein